MMLRAFAALSALALVAAQGTHLNNAWGLPSGCAGGRCGAETCACGWACAQPPGGWLAAACSACSACSAATFAALRRYCPDKIVTARVVEKQKLFETTVKVDTTDVPVAVYEGDSPASVATEFAQTHKLDQDGAMAVFYHLKQARSDALVACLSDGHCCAVVARERESTGFAC